MKMWDKEDEEPFHLCNSFSKIAILYKTRAFATCYISGYYLNGVEFIEMSLALGLWLINSGCTRKHVCIFGSNSPIYLSILFGIFYAGCVAAPLNVRWCSNDICEAMDLVCCEILFVDYELKSSIELILKSVAKNSKLRAVIYFPSTMNEINSTYSTNFHEIKLDAHGLHVLHFWDIIASSRKEVVRMDNIDFDSDAHNIVIPSPLFSESNCAVICFTSGTTSKPKGVCLSHLNFRRASLAKLNRMDYGKEPVHLHVIPLSSVAGLSSIFTITDGGGSHVFIRKFDGFVTVNALKCNITSLAAVPAMISDLVSAVQSLAEFNVHNCVLRNILIGAGRVQKDVLNEFRVLFPSSKIYTSYGMSEMTSSVTFREILTASSQEHGMNGDFHSSVGFRPDSVQLMIGDENGRNLPPYKIGEVFVKGGHLMLGYVSKNIISKDTLVHGDWFPTGDLGMVSDTGEVFLVGRLKDMIKSGGENIYAEEIEGKVRNTLLKCNYSPVHISAFGLPHSRLGEIICAAIVLRETKNCPVFLFDGLRFVRLLRESLSSFKQPRLLVVKVENVSILERKRIIQLNVSGKIMKTQLKETILSMILTSRGAVLRENQSGSTIAYISNSNHIFHFHKVPSSCM